MKGAWGAVGLMLAATGCQTARDWDDLSAPRECRSLDAPPLAVLTESVFLPIVHDGSRENRRAANFLAATLAEMTGRRPRVCVELKGQRGSWPKGGLFIGNVSANRDWPCALTNESADAFRVAATQGGVHFTGRADFAVYDWCERFLGFRDYGEGGRCVERRSAICVGAIDYSDAPAFDWREIGCGALPDWLRHAKAGGTHRGGVAVHQPARWFADEAVTRAHPEIFETGKTPMLCYGKPETLAYYKERIDRHIAGLQDSGGIVNTNRKVVTVCGWDAPLRCTCPSCAPLYTDELGPRGRASPIIWGRFMRPLAAWLKAAHPDYEISFLPYLNVCEVPRRWSGRRGFPRRRVADIAGLAALGNAEAEPCTMPGLALLKEPACRRTEERILREWHRTTGRKVLNWHYSCWPADWTSAPYVYGKVIQGHYARMRDHAAGSFVCGDPNDVRQTLSHYVWARCLWNPQIDVERVYDGFARRMFGAGANPMRALIRLQEEGWCRAWNGLDCTAENIFERSYPPEDVARMKALLAEARARAAEARDENALRRIDRYASGFAPFFADAEARARQLATLPRRRIPLGVTNEMVVARSVAWPAPTYRTTVVTAVEGNLLRFTISCDEPAVAKLDFTGEGADDFVWGNDKVEIYREGAAVVEVRPAGLVRPAGPVRGEAWAEVSRGARGWRVDVWVKPTDRERREGCVRGNVCRWRVGDRRLPEKERTPQSRYEHSRLNTCQTQPNDDPSAYVEFLLK